VNDVLRKVLAFFSDDGEFSPANINGLVGWYDASDVSTITESSNLVSAMGDKSGNLNDLSQLVGANQPLTNQGTQNGRNFIRFDGLSKNLSRSTFTNGTISQPHWVFMAIDTANTVTATRNFIDSANATNRATVYQVTSSRTLGMYVTQSLNSHVMPAEGTWVIISAKFDGANSEQYLNGASGGAGDPGTSDFIGLTLGARYDEAQSPDFDFGELIIAEGDQSGNRLEIESYLTERWGIV